jgi:hypothetical protein
MMQVQSTQTSLADTFKRANSHHKYRDIIKIIDMLYRYSFNNAVNNGLIFINLLPQQSDQERMQSAEHLQQPYNLAHQARR